MNISCAAPADTVAGVAHDRYILCGHPKPAPRYTMTATNELVEKYLNGPKQLRAATTGLTREQAMARPVSGKWSVLEVVCHLADFEPVYVERMKRVITHERPLLMAADESLFAAKLAYHDRDLEEELRVIELTRGSFGRILKTLPAEAFQRTGVHTERGLKTLEELLSLIANHIPHHVPFIAEKRKALGIPA
jgi:uncharacterized damage-inducible protein DinB